MPSRISHLWVAREAAMRWLSPALTAATLETAYPYLAMGAQGPDIFLHNHRRKPRGILFGALLHRKANDRFLAKLTEASRSEDGAVTNDRTSVHLGDSIVDVRVAAYAVGWASHVWLDRIGHPYVNYFAGWRGHPDDADERRYMHPWLERILDAQLLAYHGERLEDWAFRQLIAPPEDYVDTLVSPISGALREALTSAANDQNLSERVANALLDTVGFYFHTDNPAIRHFLKARAAELDGRAPARWMALLHLPSEIHTMDMMNQVHLTWCHPCDAAQLSDASWPQIVDQAVQRCRSTLQTMERYWTRPSADHLVKLADTIGPANLNDGLVGDPPCERRYTNPFPLASLYRRIKKRLDRWEESGTG